MKLHSQKHKDPQEVRKPTVQTSKNGFSLVAFTQQSTKVARSTIDAMGSREAHKNKALSFREAHQIRVSENTTGNPHRDAQDDPPSVARLQE